MDGFQLTFNLVCTTHDSTVTFIGACGSGVALPNVPATVTYKATGMIVFTGASDGKGQITFPNKCGPGTYTVTYGAVQCFLAGSVDLGVDCAGHQFNVSPSTPPGWCCCPGYGNFPGPLFLTDSLGTVPIGCGGSAATSGIIPHTNGVCTTTPMGKLRYTGDRTCYCELDCDEAYAQLLQSTYTDNAGPGGPSYFLECGFDDRGWYWQLSATWAFGMCCEFTDVLGPPWCRHLLTVPPSWWCQGFQFIDCPPDPLCGLGCCFDYGESGTVNAVSGGGGCVYTPSTVGNYTRKLFYGGSFGAVAVARNYIGYEVCNFSFSQSFSLLPSASVNGFGLFCPGVPVWGFEAPPLSSNDITGDVNVYCNDYCSYAPPPPGGTAITVSS